MGTAPRKKWLDTTKLGRNTATASKVSSINAITRWRLIDEVFPNQIPQGAWTHLNFAFAYVDPNDYAVVPMDPRDIPLYRPFTDLKKTNPGLETWIAVGGWSMNDPGPFSPVFREIAADPVKQEQFAKSLIAFMEQWGFDGVVSDRTDALLVIFKY